MFPTMFKSREFHTLTQGGSEFHLVACMAAATSWSQQQDWNLHEENLFVNICAMVLV